MFAIYIRIHQTFILRKNANTFLYKSYNRQTDIVTAGRQAGRQAGSRQTDRQTERQKDRQKDRETEQGQTNKQKSRPHLPYYLVELCKNPVTNYYSPVIHVLFFVCLFLSGASQSSCGTRPMLSGLCRMLWCYPGTPGVFLEIKETSETSLRLRTPFPSDFIKLL